MAASPNFGVGGTSTRLLVRDMLERIRHLLDRREVPLLLSRDSMSSPMIQLVADRFIQTLDQPQCDGNP